MENEDKVVIKPSSDIFIRALFLTPGNENITLSFINAFRENDGEEPANSVEILNPFDISTYKSGKKSTSDLRITNSDGTQTEVGIQEIIDRIHKEMDSCDFFNPYEKLRSMHRPKEETERERKIRLEEEKEIGKREVAIEISKKMKLKGMDAESISKYTGLSLEEIDKL